MKFNLMEHGNTNMLAAFRYELNFDDKDLDSISIFATKITPAIPVGFGKIQVEFIETEDFKVGNALIESLNKDIGNLSIYFKKADAVTTKEFKYSTVKLTSCYLNDLNSSAGMNGTPRGKITIRLPKKEKWYEKLFGIKYKNLDNIVIGDIVLNDSASWMAGMGYTMHTPESSESFVKWTAIFEFNNYGE